MHTPCHRTKNRAFTNPDAAHPASIRAAITICEHCSTRQSCALAALTSGRSLDDRWISPARAVIQAGVVCTGDQDTAQALATIAGVETPTVRRVKKPRAVPPTQCVSCQRPMYSWTRAPEDFPTGMVMHHARGFCIHCRVPHRQFVAKNGKVREVHLMKTPDRNRHHPETAGARAKTAARRAEEAAAADSSEQVAGVVAS